MSRQGKTPRPTRGRTIATQVGAAELAAQRAAYDGMSPTDEGFETVFGAAENAALTVESHMRRMSRPNGLSRRAAAGLFMMAHAALHEAGRATLPTHEVVQPPEQTMGALALGELGLEYS